MTFSPHIFLDDGDDMGTTNCVDMDVRNIKTQTGRVVTHSRRILSYGFFKSAPQKNKIAYNHARIFCFVGQNVAFLLKILLRKMIWAALQGWIWTQSR